MAIHWPAPRRAAVSRILLAYPKETRRCEQAAKEIMPHARKQDAAAVKWKIRPKPGKGRVLAPLTSVGEDPWFHHVFVETEHHGVDSLTGVDGTPADEYLKTHFDYPDYILQSRIE